MKIQGNEGSASEIIMIIAFVAGLILVFLYFMKREAEKAVTATADAIANAVKNAADVVVEPVQKYELYLGEEREEWLAEAEKGIVQTETPGIVSAPGGGISYMGSGEKRSEFKDIGFGILVPTELYFYNQKIW